ncbi:LysR substrate-binding domain-containing protein [Lutimaribacter marinistellae]|uniref:LysR substrate-binding domain-containing protein n=1 Tax=Lutimaribacter marinistellae TaxID=1820329 RepID=A0ABV7TJ84_9RHOB
MISPRRFLPSISSLLALEAVDRLGSATAAAAELSLTQGAISRQLKAMEEQLGVELIDRRQLRLTLTPGARDYLAVARPALLQLAQAGVKLGTNPGGGTLALSILPAFGMHWLAPRLNDFARLHPEIAVNLSTRLRPFDFAVDPFDAAIHFGRRDWPGVEYMPIMTEVVLPVCAPGVLSHDVGAPGNLANAPLLHLDTRPEAWAQWFANHGLTPPVTGGGIRFDQFSTMVQATLYGLGVSLLPSYLVEHEIERGRLIEACNTAPLSLGKYFLVWPSGRPVPAPLRAFRNWLETQIDGET